MENLPPLMKQGLLVLPSIIKGQKGGEVEAEEEQCLEKISKGPSRQR